MMIYLKQMADCSSGDSKSSRKTVTASGEKEGVGEMVACKREVTFKDQILAERNCSQVTGALHKRDSNLQILDIDNFHVLPVK